MSAKSEYEAAYFTLLRAREEHGDLMRYREWLTSEQQRLEDFAAATREREEALPRRLLRPLNATTRPMLDALGRRRAMVVDERKKIDERIASAQAFVEECEAEVASLRP